MYTYDEFVIAEDTKELRDAVECDSEAYLAYYEDNTPSLVVLDHQVCKCTEHPMWTVGGLCVTCDLPID